MSTIVSVLVFAGWIPLTFTMGQTGQLFFLGVMMYVSKSVEPLRNCSYHHIWRHFYVAAAHDLSSR